MLGWEGGSLGWLAGRAAGCWEGGWRAAAQRAAAGAAQLLPLPLLLCIISGHLGPCLHHHNVLKKPFYLTTPPPVLVLPAGLLHPG